jgi:hypothetical protein
MHCPQNPLVELPVAVITGIMKREVGARANRKRKALGRGGRNRRPKMRCSRIEKRDAEVLELRQTPACPFKFWNRMEQVCDLEGL